VRLERFADPTFDDPFMTNVRGTAAMTFVDSFLNVAWIA